MIRRTDRYTTAFPDAVPPPPGVYRDAYRKFPFWYRWYIRLQALFSASTVEDTTRRHHIHELKRTLSRESKEIIDPNIPALLPRFHQALRQLLEERDAVRPSLDEATGAARGSFLRVVLADRDTIMHNRLQSEIHLTGEELKDFSLSLEAVRHSAQARMEGVLAENRRRIESVLHPVWLALRSLNVLCRVDLKLLFPVTGSKRQETPLRAVSTSLVTLHQALELCHRHANPSAVELALAFARGRLRGKHRSPRAVWSAVETVRTQIPLLSIIRYAKGEPFLEVPEFILKTNWWTPFSETWVRNALDRCDGELLEHRHGRLLSLIRSVFIVEHEPPVWIPSSLQPKTLGILILLAGSDIFQDTRRVITQLVIDATFYHLDTRNTLHQMALQLDQALERLTTLLGDGENRGTMGEEIQRLQHRSGPSSILHRQLSTVYERHRPKIRMAVDECIDALTTAGTLIARTISGAEVAYEIQNFQKRTFAGDYPPHELLDIVGEHWQPLGSMIQSLLNLELTLSSNGGRRRDRP